MRFKRTLSAILASLLLLGTLTACAETTETPQDSEKATAGATEVESETKLTDDLPEDLNYGDDEVVIFSRYREGWTSGEIAVEKLNNEIVNDTVFERNKFVSERLGIQITSIEENELDPTKVVQKLATAVRGGADDYDLFACACYSTVAESLNGTFSDLRTTEYLDFEKPWWSQGFNEVVEYHDAQFVATGSIVLSMYRFAFVTVFNQNMFTDAKVPFLYQDVANKTWTLDRQIELVPLFHQDNGNGVQDLEGDIYGLVTNDYIGTDPYWSACNVDILLKNEDGDYEIVFDAGKLHSVAEKVLSLFYETRDGTYDFKHADMDSEQDDIRDMFANSGAAMATLRLMELENSIMRDMEDKYGVVPMPKYDEAQENYSTLLHDQFTVMSIPNTVTGDRLHQMSAVLEAMASYSYDYLRPAYYETTLRTKIAQDPESAQMLDLVIDNIYIDAGIIYTSSFVSFHDKFRQIIGSKKNTVSSDYASLEKQADRALKNMNRKFDKIIPN